MTPSAAITGVGSPTTGLSTTTTPTKPDSTGPLTSSFAQLLDDVNHQQSVADDTTLGLVTGKTGSIHEVAISMAKADLSFQLLMEVRDQLITSYQEIMRMQV